MTYRKVRGTVALVALALVVVLPATALAAAVVLHADLISPAGTFGNGTVDYQANRGDTAAKLRIDLQGIRGADSVYVVIPNKFSASIPLDGDGNGSLHLSTRRGNQVPNLQAGDVVDVLIVQDGFTELILRGTLN